jgi:hypothetical protein
MTNFTNTTVPKFRTRFPSHHHHVDEQPRPTSTGGFLNQIEELAVPNFHLKIVRHEHAAAPVWAPAVIIDHEEMPKVEPKHLMTTETKKL